MLLALMILLVGVTTAQVPSTNMVPLEQTTISTLETLDGTTKPTTPREVVPLPATRLVETILTTTVVEGTSHTTPVNCAFLYPHSASCKFSTSSYPADSRERTEIGYRRSIPQVPLSSRITIGSENSQPNLGRASAISAHRMMSTPGTSDQVPTKSLSLFLNDFSNRMTTSTASYESTTVADKPHTESPVISKTSHLHTTQPILNLEMRTAAPSTRGHASTRRETTLSVNRLSSLALPVPTVPTLLSNVDKHTQMPLNAVVSMHYLPWVNQETNEFDNVLHPTLPSMLSRRLKSGRSRNVKKTSTTTSTSSPSTTLFERSIGNLGYSTSSQAMTSKPLQTSVLTSSALNLLGIRPMLPTTPDSNGGAAINKPKMSLIGPSLPVKTNHRNQSLFHSTLANGSFSERSENTHVLPALSIKISIGNDSAFPVGGSSKGVPHNMPLLPVEIGNGNQAMLRSVFPIGEASKGNPKSPASVPSPRLKTSTEILPTIAAMENVTENMTQNCTNDYCVSDEDYIDMMLDYMFPTSYEWVLIGMHFIVFIGGLVGNALVCVAVYRNHSMRTVTNYFIVNLAVADFLVILLCLPPTVLWDVTETWFMGTALCKIVLYFQTVSVAVSVLTLTFISIDRWYAICCPLKFKSTTGRAKTAIVVIWILALAFDIPEMVVLQTKRKELSIDTLFFTQCEPSWSDKADMAFHCLQTLLLYTIPLVFMSIAYCQIVRVLWSSNNIPGHKERLNSSVINAQSASCRSDTIGRKKKINTSVTVSTTGQVICRRKAAKMLVAVVIMFAVCYFPVHLLSILRYTYDIPQTDATTAFSMVSHWLCYANSAVNPLIYNFMSGKFRKEFAHTFGCRRITWKRPAAFARRRRRRQDDVVSIGNCCNVTNGHCAVQRTEMVPLSGDCASNGVLDVEIPC